MGNNLSKMLLIQPDVLFKRVIAGGNIARVPIVLEQDKKEAVRNKLLSLAVEVK